MAKTYMKLEWPEYQHYQQFDGFDGHACFCAEDNCYFIETDWMMQQENDDAKKEREPDAVAYVKYKGKEIKLSSRFVGLDYPDWSKKDKRQHQKITIEVDYKKHSFDYWRGLSYPEQMKEKELIEAFECFLSDCISGDQTIDDFQSEFGYENVSECIRVYNACKAELEAWKNFFIDPYDLDNWLRDRYDL